jgi:hypothetical protein
VHLRVCFCLLHALTRLCAQLTHVTSLLAHIKLAPYEVFLDGVGLVLALLLGHKLAASDGLSSHKEIMEAVLRNLEPHVPPDDARAAPLAAAWAAAARDGCCLAGVRAQL